MKRKRSMKKTRTIAYDDVILLHDTAYMAKIDQEKMEDLK